MLRNIVGIVMVALLSAATGQSMVLTVTQDASIYQDDPTGNYGAELSIRMRSEDNASKGYIQFDASGQEMICGIRAFKMVSNYEYPRSADAYLLIGGNADNWNQNSITWNNAPGNNTSSATELLSDGTYTNIYLGYSESVDKDTTAWFLWDSEEAKAAVVHELNTGDRKATIVFCREGDRLVRFDSMEKGVIPIQLEVWSVPDSAVLTPVKDASIMKNYPAENFGSDTFLAAVKDSDPAKAYVQFDATGCRAITNVFFLSGVSTYQYARSARFYMLQGSGIDNWAENTITWNNAPANNTNSTTDFLANGNWTNTFLGQNEASEQNYPAELMWDSDSAKQALMNELNTGDRKVTIGIARNGDKKVWFSSKESLKGGMLLCVQTEASPTVLAVTKDADIRMVAPNTNYGSENTVKIQRDGDTSKGYLQFEVDSGLVTDIESVQMISTHQYARSAKFYILQGCGIDDWDESLISWNNAPANNTGSTTAFLTDGVWTNIFIGQNGAVSQYLSTEVEWDSDDAKQALINELNSGNRKVTIGMVRIGDRQVNLASKENEMYDPVRISLQKVNYRPVDTMISDADFLEAILSTSFCPEFSAVAAAYGSGNIAEAKHLLCEYYRGRGTNFWWHDEYQVPDQEDGESALAAYQKLLDKTGVFAPENWREDGELNCFMLDSTERRMYVFTSLGRAYRYTGNEEITQSWIKLFRAWIDQMPLEDPGCSWNRLQTAIRLSGGWGDAFVSFVHSPIFDDDNLFLFLKAYYEQALYIRQNHSETSNWLTFEMRGLYSAAVLFPEWAEADEWREFAAQTALDDCSIGWMPDGMSIELTPGYGSFFSNYLKMFELAAETGHMVGAITGLVTATERLFTPYVEMMAPGWTTPAFNDNHAVDVAGFLSDATNYFSGRQDFIWAASKGSLGAEPDYLSVVFPYAGYAAIRSGWETNANFLCFDAGPVGYRHAHQDKLGLVMWAYGRQILADNGPDSYDPDPLLSYFRDTYSHSTGLVDNRPQRRKWYQDPSPSNYPYSVAPDFSCSVSSSNVWVSGVYTGSYGLAAGAVGNESDPYAENSNFYDGWGVPASQYRQVAYFSPDIFVVQDWFAPNDTASHTYEIRWQIDSLSVATNGSRMETSDSGLPNLAIIPLRTSGLSVSLGSAQMSPDIMGWVPTSGGGRPSSTLRHLKSGVGNKGFVTLLLPLTAGSSSSGVTYAETNGVITLNLGAGRIFKITPAPDPGAVLTVQPQ